ncbi:hypothetical protein BZG35_09495 [Brevundimonas sp. LM2]|nr:hypothetical protein BZG35_09495 [Brevundimonas sp. LM2]
MGRISKMGDGYLRKLLVVGATSVIRRFELEHPWPRLLGSVPCWNAVGHDSPPSPWPTRPPGSPGLSGLAARPRGRRSWPDRDCDDRSGRRSKLEGGKGTMAIR